MFSEVNIILGERNCGKTLYTTGSEYSSRPSDKDLGIEGIIKNFISQGMKVLILMTLDHPAYQNIPLIPYNKYKEYLPRWNKPSVYRIICRPDDVNEINLYINTLDSCWNIAIIYEDSYKYCQRIVPKGIADLIIDSKQKNIWMYFMFHNWMHIPPGLYSLIDFILAFIVKQHPQCRKEEMAAYYEDALKAYEWLLTAPKYSNKLIATGNNG